MFGRAAYIFKQMASTKKVYFLVLGCMQVAYLIMIYVYISWCSGNVNKMDITPSLEIRRNYNSSNGNISLGYLGVSQAMSSFYFKNMRIRRLYAWENGGFVPVKAPKLFSDETIQMVNNSNCFGPLNKTKALQPKTLNDQFDWLSAPYTKENVLRGQKKKQVGKELNICSVIRQKDYNVNKYVFQEEMDMPIAFAILVYKEYTMLELLLRTIYKPHNTYCIHVDAKSPMFFRQKVLNLTKCFDNNVFVATKLYPVYWGTFSILEAEMSCMRDLLNRTRSWKYYINLTGQEFPLRTNYEIVKILTALRGFNNVICKKNCGKHRLIWSGPAPYGLTIYEGSTHVVLTREFIVFMLGDSKARKVINWLRKLIIPDESLVPTLVCNRVLKAPGSYEEESNVFDQLKSSVARLKLWNTGHSQCGGTYLRGICVFGTRDWPLDLQTLQESHALFANKFNINDNPDVPYCLRDILLKRTILEYGGYIDFNDSYYANIPYRIEKKKYCSEF